MQPIIAQYTNENDENNKEFTNTQILWGQVTGSNMKISILHHKM